MGVESGGIVLALNEVRADRDRLRTQIEELNREAERLRGAIKKAVHHLENGMVTSAITTLNNAL